MNKYVGVSVIEETKVCTVCHRELPLSKFYSRGAGLRRSDCVECHSSYVAKRYSERREIVKRGKEAIGCQKCGDKRHYVLDFHHTDPSVKDDTVARMVSNKNKMGNIKEEMNKCVVLCANCHREFHHLNGETGISLQEYLESPL